MKTRNLLIVLVVLALIAAMAGCTPAKPVSTGSFNGPNYTNDFFNLSFTIPDGWAVATKEQMAQAFNVGAELITGTDTATGQKLDLAKQKALYLAFVSKLPYGDPSGFNSNINVLCENLGFTGSLLASTSKAYAELAMANIKSSTKDSGMTYAFGDIAVKQMGGAEFAVFDATLTYNGMEIKQRVYCTLKNKYAILFSLTWMDDTDLASLQTIVDSIAIK